MTDASAQFKPKIVILGAGFGGVYTFLNLRKLLGSRDADITIINKTNYFLFTPLLHEVATGGLAHHQVVEPIRSFTYKRDVTLHVAEVKMVRTRDKVVETTVGDVPYDYLVIATGASPEFYNIPGAAEHTLVLKTLRDAITMRNQIIDAFERGVEERDPVKRKQMLTFVVVGGGATGVELAAEMADLFYDTFCKYFCGRIPADDVSVHLVAGETELLPVFPEKMRERAKMILEREMVRVHLGARVTAVTENGVTLADGTRLDSKYVFWTAGIKPNIPPSDTQFPISQAKGPKRIAVDSELRVLGHGNIYALGDVATFENESIPTHAQAVVQEAPVVAANIASDVCGNGHGFGREIFKYKPLGDLVSLGRWQAAGTFFGTYWTGPIAWFIWRTVYLFKFASWPKRIKIAVDWTVDIFYARDISRA